jgi:hypothetical protein
MAIGKVLSALPDAEARLRVLRWANERFNAPAEKAGDTPTVPKAAAADPMLAVDGLLSFFEPALTPHELHDAPQPIDREQHQEIGELFDEPIHRGKPELRVVARKESPAPAPLALDDLQDLYDEAPVSPHRAELEAAIADLYEQPAAPNHAEEVDEPMGDLYDAAPVQQHVDEDAAAMPFEEPVEEPIEETGAEIQPVAACEDQSLDTLVADLASALQSLTLQLEDVSA